MSVEAEDMHTTYNDGLKKLIIQVYFNATLN